MRSGLLPLPSISPYRGFGRIEVPWEEPQPGQLPDIMQMVAANAQRAQDSYQNADGTWDFPWFDREDEPSDEDPPYVPLPSPGEEQPTEDPNDPPSNGAPGGGPIGPPPTSEPEPPLDIPTPSGPDIWAGGGAFPDIAPPSGVQAPGSIGYDPSDDAGSVWDAVGALPDIFFPTPDEIPMLVPGDVPGLDKLGDLGGWVNKINSLDAIANFKEEPRDAFFGAVSLWNPAVGAAGGGLFALADILNNKGSGAREDEREYYSDIGERYAEQILPLFWENALGRNSDWVLDPWKGTGQSDADLIAGWQDYLKTGVGGRPETPYQNFGKLAPQDAGPAIANSLYDYLGTLDAQPVMGAGPGDFAPAAYLKDSIGWYPGMAGATSIIQANNLRGMTDEEKMQGMQQYGFGGWQTKLREVPEIPDLMTADPAFDEWLRSFQQERPDVVSSTPWLSGYNFGP